jgi:hypothetical protein
VLHHDDGSAIGHHAQFQHLDDVGVAQDGDLLGLGLEVLDGCRVRALGAGQELYCEAARQAGMDRFVDLARRQAQAVAGLVAVTGGVRGGGGRRFCRLGSCATRSPSDRRSRDAAGPRRFASSAHKFPFVSSK